MSRERRADRVAEAIREEVASYLTTGVKDPAIQGLVTVTGVDVTPDLRKARIFVSVLGEVDVPATVNALNNVGYQIKGQVGRTLRLRLAPELEFLEDKTAQHASHIESLLQQIRDEEAGNGNPGDSADSSTDNGGREP